MSALRTAAWRRRRSGALVLMRPRPSLLQAVRPAAPQAPAARAPRKTEVRCGRAVARRHCSQCMPGRSVLPRGVLDRASDVGGSGGTHLSHVSLVSATLVARAPITSPHAAAEDDPEVAVPSLERQKLKLVHQIARDRSVMTELKQQIELADARIMEHKTRLGEYNALFLTVSDAAKAAPRQRLGATQAVLGTKRIIERELGRLAKEIAIVEMKRNKAKDRNAATRAQINSLRQEHQTFKKLFTAMNEELSNVKGRIAGAWQCNRLLVRVRACFESRRSSSLSSTLHTSALNGKSRYGTTLCSRQERNKRRVCGARSRHGGDA